MMSWGAVMRFGFFDELPADADFSNNHFPDRVDQSRLELFKEDDESRDMMADMLRTLREAKGGEDDTDEAVPLEPAQN